MKHEPQLQKTKKTWEVLLNNLTHLTSQHFIYITDKNVSFLLLS